MSSYEDEPKRGNSATAEKINIEELKDHNIYNSNVLVDKDLMVGAYDAENREHEQTFWQSVKSHPMACMWAFIMCFTIVSSTPSPQGYAWPLLIAFSGDGVFRHVSQRQFCCTSCIPKEVR